MVHENASVEVDIDPSGRLFLEDRYTSPLASLFYLNGERDSIWRQGTWGIWRSDVANLTLELQRFEVKDHPQSEHIVAKTCNLFTARQQTKRRWGTCCEYE